MDHPNPDLVLPWRLRLNGPPQLLAPDGNALPLDRHGALVAARLALAGPQPRELLARQLWPDTDEARARGNLRQRLLRLKVQAGWAWIAGGAVLRLHPEVHLDRSAGGPLLQGLPVPADDELARWLEYERRTALRAQSEPLLQQLARAETAAQWDDALRLAEQLVALDPIAECPLRTLARLHYLNHDHGRAHAVLEEMRLMLQREHGAAPSAASEQLRLLVEQVGQAVAVPSLSSPALQRPPRCIGRAAELDCMRQHMAEHGAVLLLGEAGLGKSRLLAEAVAARADVIAVKAQSGDAGAPYATLTRLLRRRPAPVGPPPPMVHVLAHLLPELRSATASPLPAPDTSPGLLQEAVQAWLRGGGPGAARNVIVVDDLHQADAASLEMLAALVTAEPLSALAWLFAQRPGEGGDAARAFGDRLVDSGRLMSLRLAPLDDTAVADLLQSLGLAGLDAATWVPRLQRHTGGNPHFILETLKDLRAGDLAAGRLPSPATVGALIDRRLRALSPEALALARLAAIAGADFSVALAAEVTGRNALHLSDAWSELEAAQVLREHAFAHDLVLDAVRRGIPHSIAAHLHGEVARHLQRHGGDAARLAAHRLAAGNEAGALLHPLQAMDAARDGMPGRE